MKYLFLFSIGPVQSFIAQARKTQDLYAGSKILSDLAKAGLKAANPTDDKDNYIFPNKYDPELDSVPNRFLCIITANDTNDVKQRGQNVKYAVVEEWNKIAKPVLAISKEGIQQQIDNHLDINWAFVEIPADTDGGYKTAYEKIERLLGAVKNARSFTQFNYQAELGEKGRKCSLDGERNVKFYRRNENDGKNLYHNKLFSNKEEVYVIDNTNEDKFNYSEIQTGEGLSAVIQAGEGLSAVSMVKRLYQITKKASTTEISLKYQLEKLNEKEKNLYEDFKQLFSNKYKDVCCKLLCEKYIDKIEYDFETWETAFDEQLLYKENLIAKNIPNNTQLKIACQLQKDLGKYLTQKYYAIITFDGDNMGKWLSGENIKDANINLQEFHQKLSERLADFAKNAKDIVDKYGRTVYAGGDDFLGFVNLNYLFKAMQELRNEYERLVNKPLIAYRKEGQNLSFSAGVCIAHYKEPLSMVLSKAVAAQKTSKSDKKGDRNAFSIVASKHSGENHEAYFKWTENCENVNHLNCIVQNLVSNSFSNTFIKVINIEFQRLMNNDNKLLVSVDLLRAEISRTVWRSCLLKREEKESKEVFKQRKDTQYQIVVDTIMNIYQNSNNDFSNFLNALNICDFLHRLLGASKDTEKKT